MRKTKMVCVMRRDLRNKHGHKIPKGKLIAQGGHAYMGAVFNILKHQPNALTENEEFAHWHNGSFVKIALGVDSEEELFEIYDKAKEEGLNVVLIKDLGHTEFAEPTVTCIGIGPHYAERINAVTGQLSGY